MQRDKGVKDYGTLTSRIERDAGHIDGPVTVRGSLSRDGGDRRERDDGGLVSDHCCERSGSA
jgi:hypothetical protein